MRPDRLYVVSRSDLPPNQQAVQGMHALVEFMKDHSQSANDWHHSSNHLVLLVVKDESELVGLAARAYRKNLKFSLFREPDRSDELTALVLEPRSSSLCSKLRMA